FPRGRLPAVHARRPAELARTVEGDDVGEAVAVDVAGGAQRAVESGRDPVLAARERAGRDGRDGYVLGRRRLERGGDGQQDDEHARIMPARAPPRARLLLLLHLAHDVAAVALHHDDAHVLAGQALDARRVGGHQRDALATDVERDRVVLDVDRRHLALQLALVVADLLRGALDLVGRGARQLLQLVVGLAPVGLELVGVPREHEPALASGFGGRRGEPAAHPADRGRREDEDEEEEEEALHAAGLTAAAAAGEAAQRKPAAEAERSLLQTCRARS